MATNKSTFEEHSFKSFLTSYHVVIPMVQRDYAQGRETDDVSRVRSRFLNAIKSHFDGQKKNEVMKLDFVYGEIRKVYSNSEPGRIDKKIVTPLDGQQRLTTLFLLHWYAAKKDKINTEEYNFLNNFTYDIRPSSRDFCKHLISYTPVDNMSFAYQLMDQNWFMGEWKQDPTIISMLVMLDDIKALFHGINNLWKQLTDSNCKIIFYFLPLLENGLSDTLYIKMNSRGKKLTQFEHFKAEFESLYDRDSKEAIRVSHKFDVEWIDTLFSYRDYDDTVDREFMRLFFYFSHILCYTQSVKKSNDEFELIKLLYDEKGSNPAAKNNRLFLENAFDSWYDVIEKYGSIDVFFNKYLSFDRYEKDKVATYKNINEYNNSQNYFKACIKLYQVNNNFSYGDFLFLYGILTYLMNQTVISESDFIERLRILRNLIMNSDSGEIRGDADYMKDLLDEVYTLIYSGEIKTELNHGLNRIQEREELEKRAKKKNLSSQEIEWLLKFEDHPLIYGFVSGLGYDNLHLVDTFYSVFDASDYKKIHKAMISIGDYTQFDNSRYYMGNSNRSTWMHLLHKSRARKDFERRTMAVLIELLKSVSNGKQLQDIVTSYTTQQEQLGHFDWRYYFAKYGNMLRGTDGELVWGDNDYTITTLNKHQFNGKHWISFLNVIYYKLNDEFKNITKKDVVSLGDYGEKLIIYNPIASLSCTPKGFIYYQGTESQEWNVQQHEGFDTENRVEMVVNKLKSLIQNALDKANVKNI